MLSCYALQRTRALLNAESSNLIARSCAEVPRTEKDCYIGGMHDTGIAKAARRPRFRRAAQPPPFRLTDKDIEIIRLIARHQFMRSNSYSRASQSIPRPNE